METISKETFWLQLLENPSLYGTITTEDNVFNYRSDCVWQVMNDTFIANGNDFETTKWEEMLGITTDETSLNARKANILNFITENVPITVKILEQFIKGITNNDYVFEYDDKTQNLFISLYCDYENNSNIPSLISRVIPSSVDVELEFSMPSDYISAEWLGTDTGDAYITVPLNKKANQTLKIETQHYTTTSTSAMMEGATNRMFVGTYSGLAHSYLFVYFNWAAAGTGVRGDWNTHIVEVKHNPNRQIIYYPEGERVIESAGNDQSIPTYTLFRVLNTTNLPWVGKKRTWKAWLDGELLFNLAPAISPDGVACMFNKISKEAYYNIGEEDFIVGMNLRQALKLSQLPNTGGELTVSLPWEAQFISSGIPNTLQVCADNGWTIKVQYRDVESELYNKYALCTTVEEIQAINSDYINDLTDDGEWIYLLPKLKMGSSLFYGGSKLTNFISDLSSLTDGYSMFLYCGKLKSWSTPLPKLTGANSMFYFTGMQRWDVPLPVLSNGNQMFCQCTSLTSFSVELPKLSNGTGMFQGCKLDKESALCILNSIPTYTSGSHPLFIGIHIDHQSDDDVLTAISNAEEKGWTMTVQWNGTPTAQSTSSYAFGRNPIYAKKNDFILPDNTVKSILYWGHYVTNWEENGYQEFSSVEEAKEYFNTED